MRGLGIGQRAAYEQLDADEAEVPDQLVHHDGPTVGVQELTLVA